MSDDFRVTGMDDIQKLSKALKESGDFALRKELVQGLKDAAKTLTPFTREVARHRLPRHGGLNERVAKAPQRAQVSSGRDPAVRLIAGKQGSGAAAADAGHVRHPVFGNRTAFAVTPVTPGWFSDTIDAHREAVVKKIEDVADAMVKKVIARG